MDNEVNIKDLRFKFGILFAVGENPSVEWNALLIKHILNHLGGDVDNHKIPTMMWNELTTNRMFGIIEGTSHVVSMPIKKDAKCLVFPEGVYGKFTEGAPVTFVISSLINWVVPHQVVPTNFLKDRWWNGRIGWDNAGGVNPSLILDRVSLIDSISYAFEDYMNEINEKEHKYTWLCDHKYNPAQIDTGHGNYITYFDLVHNGNDFNLKIRYQQVQYDRSEWGIPSGVDFYMPRYDNTSEKDLEAINSFDDGPRVRLPKHTVKAEWVIEPVSILAMTSHGMTTHDARQEYITQLLKQIVPDGLKSIEVYIYKNDKKVVLTKKSKIMATKTTSMFDKMVNKWKQQFQLNKVDNVAMTMDGNIALQASEDTYCAIVDGQVQEYPSEAVFEMPFYSLFRPVKEVSAGDYIFIPKDGGKSLVQVTSVSNGTLTVIRFNGEVEDRATITDKLTGLNTVEVLINPLNMSYDGTLAGNPQMQAMMPMMVMMSMSKDGGKMDFEQLFMMSMMTGGNNPFQGMLGGNGAMNNMMPMMLMSSMSGGKMDFEKMFAMSMLMGGNNPFQSMFQCNGQGKQQEPSKPARKTRSDKGISKKPRVAPDGDSQADPDLDTEQAPAQDEE